MEVQKLIDIHTHHAGRKEALLSLTPQQALGGCTTPYSLELHPWKLRDAVGDTFVQAVQQLAGDPFLMAIGECGLDNKCGIPLSEQLPAFRLALAAAQHLQMPVIIHCVGYWAEMMQCVKEFYPLPVARNWGGAIVHGFRKGPELARQLLDAGFSLSLGEKFNPEVAALVPEERLFFETDESETDIWTIREKILSLRK